MDKDVREKWVQALRNDYKQCRNTLRKRDTKGFHYSDSYRYCCLGVLNDLFVPDVKWRNTNTVYIMGKGSREEEYVHPFVIEKAGFEDDELDGHDVRVPVSVDIQGDNGEIKHIPRGTTLSKQNDDVKLSFEEIAKVVEKAF